MWCCLQGYLLGHRAVATLVRFARRYHHEHSVLLPVEDALIGILAEQAGLAPAHIPRFVDIKTALYHEPLSTAILVHGALRWGTAEAWTEGRVIHAGPPRHRLAPDHSPGDEPLVTDGCDCASRRQALCTSGDTHHGCWYVCCSHWVPPSMSNIRPRGARNPPAPLPLPLSTWDGS